MKERTILASFLMNMFTSNNHFCLFPQLCSKEKVLIAVTTLNGYEVFEKFLFGSITALYTITS